MLHIFLYIFNLQERKKNERNINKVRHVEK